MTRAVEEYANICRRLKLHRSAADGDLIWVQKLFARDPSLIHERDPDQGATPLHSASLSGRTPVVNFLISKGADVNATTNVGRTPLHWAAMRSHQQVAQILLASGASLNARDDDGQTLLNLARTYGTNQIIAFLRGLGGEEYPYTPGAGG